MQHVCIDHLMDSQANSKAVLAYVAKKVAEKAREVLGLYDVQASSACCGMNPAVCCRYFRTVTMLPRRNFFRNRNPQVVAMASYHTSVCLCTS